jgi:hypothetical protein
MEKVGDTDENLVLRPSREVVHFCGLHSYQGSGHSDLVENDSFGEAKVA